MHVNLPFREPLVPTGAELVPAPGRSDGRPWISVAPLHRPPDDATIERVATAVRGTARGVLLAGWGAGVTPATATRFAKAAGWPVLADPISGLRSGDLAVSTYDALLRIERVASAQRPDLAVRVGAPSTSKVAMRWLGTEVAQWMIDPDGAWLDPERCVEASFACDAELLLGAVADTLESSPTSSDWLDGWMDLEARARRALDDLLDGWADPFEGRVARDLVAGLPDGANLGVASSMPVRDVESFAAPRGGLRLLANRGVNGIDGFISTVLGAAAAADGPMVGLVGDLCFLHDANGLLGVGNRAIDATFVVVDNDGGGIFSFLPQAENGDHFEMLFGTPHGIDIAAVAAVH
ncbi:MAG: thiamine pyrophosphate-dependent enzyme, partial [Myxococcota bacterium]